MEKKIDWLSTAPNLITILICIRTFGNKIRFINIIISILNPIELESNSFIT